MAKEKAAAEETAATDEPAAAEPTEDRPSARRRGRRRKGGSDSARDAEARARDQVNALRGFYNHAAIYAAVNVLLFLIDLLGGGGVWFFWPLLGWGLVLAIHAGRVFDLVPWLSAEWEERKVREILERNR